MTTAKTAGAKAPAKSKHTIFIAEDDKFLSNIYSENFKKKGVNVEVYGNGKVAVDALAKRKPDLMLLDLHMPEMDGFSVLRQMKLNQWVFPVIILSNLRTDIDMEKTRELGAVDFVVKSDVSFKELWEKIETHLEK